MYQIAAMLTRENKEKWHVDHIKPMVSFNIKEPTDAEFQEACEKIAGKSINEVFEYIYTTKEINYNTLNTYANSNLSDIRFIDNNNMYTNNYIQGVANFLDPSSDFEVSDFVVDFSVTTAKGIFSGFTNIRVEHYSNEKPPPGYTNVGKVRRVIIT